MHTVPVSLHYMPTITPGAAYLRYLQHHYNAMFRASISMAEGLAQAIPTSNQLVLWFAVSSLLVLGFLVWGKEAAREWGMGRGGK